MWTTFLSKTARPPNDHGRPTPSGGVGHQLPRVVPQAANRSHEEESDDRGSEVAPKGNVFDDWELDVTDPTSLALLAIAGQLESAMQPLWGELGKLPAWSMGVSGLEPAGQDVCVVLQPYLCLAHSRGGLLIVWFVSSDSVALRPMPSKNKSFSHVLPYLVSELKCCDNPHTPAPRGGR